MRKYRKIYWKSDKKCKCINSAIVNAILVSCCRFCACFPVIRCIPYIYLKMYFQMKSLTYGKFRRIPSPGCTHAVLWSLISKILLDLLQRREHFFADWHLAKV